LQEINADVRHKTYTEHDFSKKSPSSSDPDQGAS
jgi:hypothetical protein